MASLCDKVYMIKWTSNINTLIQAHVSSSNKEPPGWCNSPSTPYYQLDQNCIILPGKTGKHSCSRLGVYNWQLIKDNWYCSVCIQVCVWHWEQNVQTPDFTFNSGKPCSCSYWQPFFTPAKNVCYSWGSYCSIPKIGLHECPKYSSGTLSSITGYQLLVCIINQKCSI